MGTYQIAIVAKTFKKPFYVAAESFKFVRQYPLTQSDISNIEYINKPEFSPVDNNTLPQGVEVCVNLCITHNYRFKIQHLILLHPATLHWCLQIWAS